MTGPNGFDLGLWTPWFLATAGIGSVLAGLVLAAFAGSFRQLAVVPGASARLAEALLLLAGLPLVAVAGLWPSDSIGRVGLVIAAIGAGSWLAISATQLLAPRSRGARGPAAVVRIGLAQVATIATVLGGLSYAMAVGPGLDLLLIAALAAIAGGLLGGWRLLLDLPQ